MARKYDFDLIVIGSGAGGSVGSNLAASLGKRVMIVERDTIGGECPNFGCVPTKALLHAAERYEQAKADGEYGTSTGKVKFDWDEVIAWKDLVVSRTGSAEGEAIFHNAGIEYVHGEAKFINPHTIVIKGKEYTAEKFLIATGTSDFIPPIPGLKEAGYITYREAIDLPKLPKSLLIMGGGPIGCEFAQIFSGFDVKVTMVEFLPRLLAREDTEVGELVQAMFEARGIDVFINSKVVAVEEVGGRKEVHYETNGRRHSVVVDEILVSTGKRPNVNLGLEAAGVKYGKTGIEVNKHLQTSAAHIYAAGDVVGPYMFTHTAEYQSHTAVHNAFKRKKIIPHYRTVPRCVFTSPEVGSVGMTEEAARARGIKVKVGTTPLAIIGRANTSDEANGFVKVTTDDKGVIIGASIVAPRAGEMIHELALAVELRAKASVVGDMIHAFPTFSEAVKFACSSVEP